MTDIIRNATVPIAELRPHQRNYRKHPEAQITRLAASLTRFSQVRSIVVQESTVGTFLLVAGHGLVEAAKRLGYTHLRADILPWSWSATDIEGYLVADNATSMGAEDDLIELAQLLEEQKHAGYDLASLGFTEEGLDQLLADLADEALAQGGRDADDPDGGGDNFDVTPDEEQTRVQRGDIWQCGRHRVMCGDSTSTGDIAQLMDGTKADILFTDPPYGVGYEGGQFNPNRERLAGDDTTALYAEFLPVVLPFVDGPCYMWFAGSKARDVYNAVFDNHCEVHALLIWHKTNATYAAMNAQYKQRHEPCLYFKPKGSTLRWCGPTDERTVWELPRDPRNIYHPTQKPVSLSIRALGNHDIQIVLDCFSGSGSTLIGAERVGCIAYVNELSPQYVNVTLTRWEKETGRTATLLYRDPKVVA